MSKSEFITTMIAGLALATNVIYVALTFVMLRSIRRDALREHRLRHLDDIKTHVVQPLLSWIGSFAIPPLNGRALPIAPRDTPIPKPNAPLGDLTVHYRRHLEGARDAKTGMDAGLFKHAKEHHFEFELKSFEEFDRRLSELLFEMAAAGRECADTIAAMTNLRRASAVVSTEYVDSDYFVAACFKDLLAGVRPQVSRMVLPDESVQLFHSHSGNFAHGPQRDIEQWWTDADKLVAGFWHKTGFAERARQLITEARIIDERIRSIEFTYNLGNDCEYITGRIEHGRQNN
ncbi:MAG TPA: hypothetical protein VN682_26540 [Terriglobales bacterium]|nr:hypothetical protein [Terriglobales bacterium]HXF14917.1 hypothetical protein [Terriglobales bacterium]